MRPIVYVVSTADGWLSYNDATNELEYTADVEDAAIFSRAGALSVAKRHNGHAWAYNLDTRKLRKVNH